MRIIDADQLYERVEESRRDNPHKDPKIMINHINEHGHFLDMIIEAPTVDAEPVRHGHWIEDHMNWKCSCCGIVFKDELERIISYDGHYMPNHCPNCGAKMDLEEIEREVEKLGISRAN